ncbi:MAG: signal peptidase II [Anaerolineae bacterium]
MSSNARRWLFLIVLAGAVVLIDQIAKSLIIANLYPGESVAPIEALAPYFRLTYSQNTGAAFGFLPQAGDLFLIMAIIICATLFVFYPRISDKAWLTRIGVALVVGGAIGNALDRLIHGAVTDFVHLTIPGLVSNVSNFADHAIVLGVILILIDSWFVQGRQKEAPAPPPHEDEPPATE